MIKCRQEDYLLDKDGNSTEKGQEFSKFEKVYHFNDQTGMCEETDELINVDELVNSARDCALSAMLERFMPVYDDDDIGMSEEAHDRLDEVYHIGELAENYRERYNLPADYSFEQIFGFVKDESNKLLDQIKNNKFGGAENGKEINQESVQGELPQDGTQSESKEFA